MLPKEAREGLERAWLELLKERHPDVSWRIAKPIDAPSAPQQTPPVCCATRSKLANELQAEEIWMRQLNGCETLDERVAYLDWRLR